MPTIPEDDSDWSPNLEDRRTSDPSQPGIYGLLGFPLPPGEATYADPKSPEVQAAYGRHLAPYDDPSIYGKYLGLPPAEQPVTQSPTTVPASLPPPSSRGAMGPQFASTPAAHPAGYEPGGSALPPGASRSYRNNNPGNIIYSPFAQQHGAIGKDAQGSAIFPDVQTGTNAQAALWQTPRYSDQPLSEAMKSWAARPYAQHLGVDPSLTYGQLTPDQQQSVLARQKQMEGWIPPPGMNQPTLPPPGSTMPLSLTPVSHDPFATDQQMGPEGG